MFDCTLSFLTPTYLILFSGIIISSGYLVYERREPIYIPKFSFAESALGTCVILLVTLHVTFIDPDSSLSQLVTIVCTEYPKSEQCTKLTQERQQLDNYKAELKLTYTKSHACAPYMSYELWRELVR